MSIYLDVRDDEGKPTIMAIDSVADLCDEAALELEVNAPRVSHHLFDTAKLLRTMWGVTGLPTATPAQACAIDSANCPGCGGQGCPACRP
jgi:hypothetical protein